jgi:hypothetical protein
MVLVGLALPVDRLVVRQAISLRPVASLGRPEPEATPTLWAVRKTNRQDSPVPNSLVNSQQASRPVSPQRSSQAHNSQALKLALSNLERNSLERKQVLSNRTIGFLDIRRVQMVSTGPRTGA